MIKNVIKSFNKLGNWVRKKLSNYPILYAFLGGIGVVFFWRGVWHLADDMNIGSIISIIIGSIILMITGVFVSTFIGNQFIISGLVGEKKLVEKEEGEIETEEGKLKNLQNTLSRLETKLDHMETHLEDDTEKR